VAVLAALLTAGAGTQRWKRFVTVLAAAVRVLLILVVAGALIEVKTT
jgi:hypothetical protein